MVGYHRGFWFHTVGQRKGIPLSGGPWCAPPGPPARAAGLAPASCVRSCHPATHPCRPVLAALLGATARLPAACRPAHAATAASPGHVCRQVRDPQGSGHQRRVRVAPVPRPRRQRRPHRLRLRPARLVQQRAARPLAPPVLQGQLGGRGGGALRPKRGAAADLDARCVPCSACLAAPRRKLLMPPRRPCSPPHRCATARTCTPAAWSWRRTAAAATCRWIGQTRAWRRASMRRSTRTASALGPPSSPAPTPCDEPLPPRSPPCRLQPPAARWRRGGAAPRAAQALCSCALRPAACKQPLKAQRVKGAAGGLGGGKSRCPTSCSARRAVGAGRWHEQARGQRRAAGGRRRRAL